MTKLLPQSLITQKLFGNPWKLFQSKDEFESVLGQRKEVYVSDSNCDNCGELLSFSHHSCRSDSDWWYCLSCGQYYEVHHPNFPGIRYKPHPKAEGVYIMYIKTEAVQ